MIGGKADGVHGRVAGEEFGAVAPQSQGSGGVRSLPPPVDEGRMRARIDRAQQQLPLAEVDLPTVVGVDEESSQSSLPW